MHLKRIAVALVGVPLLYLLVTRLDPFFFLIFTAAVATLALHEFYAMYRTETGLAVVGVIGSLALYFATYFFHDDAPGLSAQVGVSIAFLIAATSARLFRTADPAAALKDLAPAVVGFFYIPLLLLPLWLLKLEGSEWVMLLLFCVWGSDTFAYYIGKGIGKRKLYASVSPNKTVAGGVGSVAGGVVSAFIAGALFMSAPPYVKLALIGALLGAVTIVGDLVESMFKRDAGIKDSGSLIPGHGGVLDRIDSLLFAAPALYALLRIL